MTPGRAYRIAFDLHFTTWTIRPGHRLRLSISNAMFPTLWPSPYKMTTHLYINHEETSISIPFVEEIPSDGLNPPLFTQMSVSEEDQYTPIDGYWYDDAGAHPRQCTIERKLLQSPKKINSKKYSKNDEKVSVTIAFDYYGNIKNTIVGASLAHKYTANDQDPSRASWVAKAKQIYIFNVDSKVKLQNKDGYKLSDWMTQDDPSLSLCLNATYSKSMERNLNSNTKSFCPSLNSFYRNQSFSLMQSPFQTWPGIETSPTLRYDDHRVIELNTALSITSNLTHFVSVLFRDIYENGTIFASAKFESVVERWFQ